MNGLKLERLPRWLTLLATGLSAVGLTVLALLAVLGDADRVKDSLNARNLAVASTVRAASQYTDTLITGYLNGDQISGGCPQFAVIHGGAAQCQVMVDPELIRRAVRNLLENAVRYGRQPEQEAIVHITVANGRVMVADHGPGIDASIADDLLDRFRTGAGSTGLGLSIVSWIAQAHGGRLDVYNAEEGGAIFELVLPPVQGL